MKILFKINKSALGGADGDFRGDARDVAYIEGLLEIYREGRLLFSDPYFPLLEFAVALSPWLASLNTERKTTFRFETMQFSEGPILEIINEEDQWRLISIWQKFELLVLITEDCLYECLREFMKEFDRELFPVCGFNVEYYL